MGSVHGRARIIAGVHLSGPKTGVWHDFATGESGDALDLVKAVLGAEMGAALTWSRRWLDIEDGIAVLPTVRGGAELGRTETRRTETGP